MHEINTELAVKYLVEELNLKNEAELAEKLQMTKNALSMLKKRNSLGTLIEKVLTNIDANVSMDRLVYGYSSNCFRAQTLAIENQKEDELATILENFIDSQTIMIKLRTKIQRIKGQNFFEKLFYSVWQICGTSVEGSRKGINNPPPGRKGVRTWITLIGWNGR